MHGNATYAHCLNCGIHYQIEPFRNDFEHHNIVPDCDCGGWIVFATVFIPGDIRIRRDGCRRNGGKADLES